MDSDMANKFQLDPDSQYERKYPDGTVCANLRVLTVVLVCNPWVTHGQPSQSVGQTVPSRTNNLYYLLVIFSYDAGWHGLGESSSADRG